MLEKIKKNKFLLFSLILIILISFTLAARFTFAYLDDNIMSGKKTDADADMEELYTFNFIPGDSLSMEVDGYTLTQGGDDIVKVAKPKVELTHAAKSTAYYYYVYLVLSENLFVYTSGSTPEIILKINKGNQEIKSTFGTLTYSESIGGYDITTKTGTFALGRQTLNSGTGDIATDDWTFTLTYKNLASDQSANLNKELEVKIVMQEEETLQIASLCSEENAADCLITYKDDTLVKPESDATVIDVDNKDNEASEYRFVGSNNLVNNFVCLDGTQAKEGACSNGNNDLYRIIGLFKNKNGKYEIKLIKYDYATKEQLGDTASYKEDYKSEKKNYLGNTLVKVATYLENKDTTNEWSKSSLNINNLNDYYLNTYLKNMKKLDVDSLIASHDWYINGTSNYEASPFVIRQDEENGGKTSQNKIGLMNAYDYGFAPTSEITNNWRRPLSDYNNKEVINNNWIYMGLNEWMITNNNQTTDESLYVTDEGLIKSSKSSDSSYAVRPVFYLADNVKIAGGLGSKDNPYRLSVEK